MCGWVVAAPGFQILEFTAKNETTARKIAREMLGVGKLPKGTEVTRFDLIGW